MANDTSLVSLVDNVPVEQLDDEYNSLFYQDAFVYDLTRNPFDKGIKRFRCPASCLAGQQTKQRDTVLVSLRSPALLSCFTIRSTGWRNSVIAAENTEAHSPLTCRSPIHAALASDDHIQMLEDCWSRLALLFKIKLRTPLKSMAYVQPTRNPNCTAPKQLWK